MIKIMTILYNVSDAGDHEYNPKKNLQLCGHGKGV